MASVSTWSDLPGELLRIVIAGLPDPVDHARFRAVCRSWRSVPSVPKLPKVLLPAGHVLLPFESAPHRMIPLPENQRFIGTTDCFVAIDYTDAHNRHTYVLTNPFSKTMVELPELDAVIGGHVQETFEIHKVLMHSGLDGLVVIRTNNRNHPVILLKPGKGVWLPKPRHQPFTRIIDVAFLGDTLYAITQAENLISFGITFDSQGKPTVTSIKRVITCPVVSVEKDKDGLRRRTGDYIINDGMHFADDDERPHVVMATLWYLVESQGKLLMVRREMQRPCDGEDFTRKVDVFEANISASTWVPVLSGLHGRALFLSKRASKSIIAGDEIEKDAIYFIDTGEVFNLRFKTTSPPNKENLGFRAMWLFCPGCF